MRSFAAFIVWPLLVILLTFTTASGVERPKLIVGGDHDNPPYEYFENGKPTGFNIELIRAVSEVMGFEVEFRLGPWSKVREELEQGKIDALAGMYYSPQRGQLLDFSVLHTLVTSGIFVRKGSPIRSFEEIRGKEVIVQNGDVIHDYLRLHNLTPHVIPVTDPGEALKLLASGKHDCALMPSRLQGEYLVKKFNLTNVRFVRSELPQLRYCFAVRKGNRELLYRLDEGLNILKLTGKYREINEKWFGVYEKKNLWETVRYYVLALVLSLGLFLGFLIWSGMLKRRVELQTAELRRGEEKLRFTQYAIDRTISQAFWMTKDGRFFYVNDAACRALGYRREELLKLSIPDIDPIYQPEKFAEHWRDIQQNGYATFETVHRAKDGRVYPVEIRANYVVFDGREYNCAFATDISERKRAEEQLRNSEGRLRTLVQTLPDLVWLKDKNGVYLSCNFMFERLYNASEAVIVGKTDYDFVDRELADFFTTNDRKAIAAGKPTVNEECLTFADDCHRALVETIKTPVYDGDGGLIGVLGIGRDITQRKQAEEELRENAEKFRVLAETSPAAICVYQGEYIIYCNAAMISLTGYTEPELKEMRFWEWMHEDYRESVRERGLARQRGESVLPQYEIKFKAKDGEEKWLFLSAGRIEYRCKPAGIVTMFDITDRKRMEDELREARDELEIRVEERTAELAETVKALSESEARLKLAMDLAKLGAWEYDDGTGMFSLDDQFYALYGTTDEREGGPLMSAEVYARKFIPPEESAVVANGIEEARVNSHFQLEHRIIRADGEERFIVVRGEAVFDQEGRFVKIRGANQDITERKRAEEEVRESSAKYQAIVDNFEGYIYICSQDYRIEFMNRKLIERTGYDATGQFCFKMMHDRDSVCPWCVNERVFAGETVSWEMCSPKDNRWFYVVNVPIPHADGTISKQSMMLDITDRKQAEEELRKANMVVENSPVVLFRCKAAPGWPVELVSKNVVRFGYTPEEFLSGELTYSSIVYSRDLERLIAETEEFSATGKGQWFQEYRIVTKWGDIRWIVDETACERNEEGEITYYEGVIIDVTERRKAEEQLILQQIQLRDLNRTLEVRVQEEVAKNREKDIILIQQNRQAALGEMLDHIAHQWKQPLNSIALIIQLLEESWSCDELTDEDVKGSVGKTMALVEHMSQTISVFRNFYRPEKEQVVFRLKDSIDTALSFMAPALRYHGIIVKIDAAPELSAIGYPNEYAQVLLNILANARDTFKERIVDKPVLNIKAFAENEKAVVAITDNAGGIPEAFIGKIFDLYFTTRESSEGTGIGLYMSKNIIEKNMAGKLCAANVDDGAQFRIEISMPG